jgi:hypothetical protein
MAQTILCDFEGCGREHDLIVSVHENGDTAAWCYEHMAFYCQAYLAQWEEANPPQDVAEPEPEQSADAGPAPEPEQEPPAGDDNGVPVTYPQAPDPGVTEVVKRGTSPSRRRHEAKRREKERAAADASQAD